MFGIDHALTIVGKTSYSLQHLGFIKERFAATFPCVALPKFDSLLVTRSRLHFHRHSILIISYLTNEIIDGEVIDLYLALFHKTIRLALEEEIVHDELDERNENEQSDCKSERILAEHRFRLIDKISISRDIGISQAFTLELRIIDTSSTKLSLIERYLPHIVALEHTVDHFLAPLHDIIPDRKDTTDHAGLEIIFLKGEYRLRRLINKIDIAGRKNRMSGLVIFHMIPITKKDTGLKIPFCEETLKFFST